MANEIERRFFIKSLPDDLTQYPSVEIQQGYLSVSEEREVRLRKASDCYSLTVKIGQGLVREEIETTLSEAQFKALWSATLPQRLVKTRYIYPISSHEAHIDIYSEALDGLNIVEIEFESELLSQAFEPPQDFGEEITDFGSFFNLKKVMSKL